MIQTIEQLEAIYGQPVEVAMAKETNYITPEYAKLIKVSPFVALASSGTDGLDCTPRGDEKGFVRIHDDKTLMMPDRRGNNRIDTLKNIVCDPKVALLFLIPGSNTTFRVNGEAHLSDDSDLLATFGVGGKAPRCVIIIDVKAAYFQCGRAIVRSHLWKADHHCDPANLPSAGDMIAATTQGREGGKNYDDGWTDRAKKTLW